MNVLIVPDKFKGSLTASEVIVAIESGLRRQQPGINLHHVVASDGGDGFLEAVAECRAGLEMVECRTCDPLGRSIVAEYGWDAENATAYVEMARASGMELLDVEERNPAVASTEGTGRLIVDAIKNGAKKVYVGLGGSATNDGGCGIAKAFGYRFVDGVGETVDPVGGRLHEIRRIDSSAVLEGLSDVQVIAVNDVSNPLLGSQGAARVYAPQKGADAAMVKRLEIGLNHLQSVVVTQLQLDEGDEPGAGAAGGTGYGLKVFLGGQFISGVEFVLALAGMERLLAGGKIDLIITGEGRIDDQTSYGKLVRGVADVGRKYGVPVKAICGVLEMKERSVEDLGLEAVVQIHDPARPIEETIEQAASLVQAAAAKLLAG
ncbi:glycerate kinase [Rhodopirellula sp. MGV]|uniref:glycerate kinase n=1 Tax=Rhodopirellula sp. MGV TaxID=2023130 RepID=UPI000B9621AA|nr:glycerate kinase [Rhodopirellula sp. MGV]OYP34027.1 hypothetical protein CGZ80_16570 [Rhodopirellula sp. MGV]PNY38345.1 glycerate kinase [Rhodopirellula baltica]